MAELFYKFSDGKIKFKNPDDKKKFDKLKLKPIQSPLFPNRIDLMKLNVWDEIVAIFEQCGIEFIVAENPESYKWPLLEFLSSLKIEWKIGNDGCKFAESWTFQLNGGIHTISREKLRDFLGCGVNPSALRHGIWRGVEVSEQDRILVWRKMSGREDAYWYPGAKQNAIVKPAWRIAHRLLSSNVFTKKEGGATINTDEMNILVHLWEKKSLLEIMDVYSFQFDKYANVNYKGVLIGGGHVVTMIAKCLKIDLSRLEPLPRTALGLEQLKHMKIHDGNDWILPVAPTLADLADWKRIEEKNPSIPKPVKIAAALPCSQPFFSGPSSFQTTVDEGGSSSYPPPSNEFDLKAIHDLLAKMDEVGRERHKEVVGMFSSLNDNVSGFKKMVDAELKLIRGRLEGLENMLDEKGLKELTSDEDMAE